MELEFASAGNTLKGHLARPGTVAVGDAPRCGLVLCSGFPADPPGKSTSPQSYPELADRLA